MLVIKAYLNQEQIDEIHVQNDMILYMDEETTICSYKIRRPKGYDDEIILHARESGWRPLAEEALRRINKYHRELINDLD